MTNNAGRPKIISDDEMKRYIDDFFKLKDYNPMALKIHDIGEYIRRNGCPDLKDYTLRRYGTEYIRKLIDENKEKTEIKIATYNAINVDDFFEKTLKEQRQLLVDYNEYNRNVITAASKALKCQASYLAEIEDYQCKLKNVNIKLSDLIDQNKKLREDKKMYESKADQYLKIIRKKVDPSIAANILGIDIPGAEIADMDNLFVIDSETDISKLLSEDIAKGVNALIDSKMEGI